MYAIVDVAGKQFRVSKNDKILVPKIEGEPGKDIALDRVLLISDKDKVTVGTPLVKGASVTAKIMGFGRGEKVTVFKKKRRKGYQVKRGHRQHYTELMIKNITAKAPAAKAKTQKTSKTQKTETAPKTQKREVKA